MDKFLHTLEILEGNIQQILDRLDFLKLSLLNDKNIDDYYEYASFVESLAQCLWDIEYWLNELEILQDNIDNKEYINCRQTVSSDKKMDVIIEDKFYDTKRKIRHYAWLVKRLRTRYWWTTKVLDWCHDWFFFNSRVN